MTRLIKQDLAFEEFAVPLTISISPAPLYIAVLVPMSFPIERPYIRILSEVTHPCISDDLKYIGASLLQWSQQSVLVQIVQKMHAEFQAQPPMPKGQFINQV